MVDTDKRTRNVWQRLNGPLKVGLGFALLAIILTIVGVLRDPQTPVTAWSLGVGSLISGLTWGLVSWAIATAAVEVEEDVRESESAANEARSPEPDEPV